MPQRIVAERPGPVHLHSAIDGYSRLAYTEALDDEKGASAVAFLARPRAWSSEQERSDALAVWWNLHYNHQRSHGAHGGQPPASQLDVRVNNVQTPYG